MRCRTGEESKRGGRAGAGQGGWAGLRDPCPGHRCFVRDGFLARADFHADTVALLFSACGTAVPSSVGVVACVTLHDPEGIMRGANCTGKLPAGRSPE